MIERKRFRVTGRVQGVSFRATVATEARGRGLRGWIRNERDGAVVGVVEGDGAEIESLFAWCQHAVPAARVDSIVAERETDPDAEPLASFTVR